jgi:hypothetical protein
VFGRPFGDFDVIATDEEIQSHIGWHRARGEVQHAVPAAGGQKYVAIIDDVHWEFEIAWSDSTGRALLDLVAQDPKTRTDCSGFEIPSLDVLYVLKLSHRYLKDSPHFLKTMRDIQALRTAGAKVPDAYREWLRAREKATYTYGHPSLNVAKADFFRGDGVQYVYDHDSIHRAMAHLDRPAYTFFQKDGAEVACDRAKFEAAPLATRIYSVVEESYVLALERSQIPFRARIDPTWSFHKALEKVCTSITSGWWREFAWEHYDAALAAYRPTTPSGSGSGGRAWGVLPFHGG